MLVLRCHLFLPSLPELLTGGRNGLLNGLKSRTGPIDLAGEGSYPVGEEIALGGHFELHLMSFLEFTRQVSQASLEFGGPCLRTLCVAVKLGHPPGYLLFP